jgi:hypothetical protein
MFIVSPLGAVPKKTNGVQIGWRRIHDLSSPNGLSVKDGLPQEFGSHTKLSTAQSSLRNTAKAAS